MEKDPLLSTAEAAARAGIPPATWRAYRSRGYLPEPDDPDEDRPPQVRRPRWRASTVDRWRQQRPGQGHRTDLTEGRVARRARDRVDLAEPSRVSPELRTWLVANHRHLRAVAEVLVDHREVLVAAAPVWWPRPDASAEMAGVIDQAGMLLGGGPSLGLASAVAYAIFLVGDGGPEEVREVLARYRWLRGEFEAVRPNPQP